MSKQHKACQIKIATQVYHLEITTSQDQNNKKF